MKLKLTLLTFCLFAIGLFSHAQAKKTTQKTVVEDGYDPVPVTVVSKKKHPAPHALPQYDKNGKLLPAPPPPPKAANVHFQAQKIKPAKDPRDIPPPPPPKPASASVNSKAVAPPPPPKNGELRFKAPKKLEGKHYDKDGNIIPPPPPPQPSKNGKPVSPDAAPAPDERA